jgi:hypothetical protein
MKSKLSIVLAMCALMLGLSVTGAAQVTKHRTRDGRIIYQTQTRDNRGYDRRNDRRNDDQRWNNQRNDRRYNDRDDRRYNDRDDYRRNDQRNNQDWRRQNQGQVYQNQQQTYGARTYRLPNGRLVTILPDGRRIYR